MRRTRERLRAAEKKLDQQPPFDLVGRFYDTLTQEEKRRFWLYVYGGQYSTKTAEYLEENFCSGTLHFICELKPGDVPFPELDAITAGIDRLPI